MLNDLTDAIDDCSLEYILTRVVSVGMDKGRKTGSVVERFAFHASITPITGKDMKRLAEGQLSTGSKLILTSTELFTTETGACRVADVVRVRNDDYQISVVKDWVDQGGFYECVGTRMTR